jgi:hypothetical protein
LCERVARCHQIIELEGAKRMERQPANALRERPLVSRLIVPLPLRRQYGFIEFMK